MRTLILAAIAVLFTLASSPTHAVFTPDDRYFDSRAAAKPATQRVRVARSTPKVKQHRRASRHRRGHEPVPLPRSRPGTVRDYLPTINLSATFPAVTRAALSGRPAGCPARAWCGCWLAKYLGMASRSLWLARNWAKVGTATTARAGAIVVFARGRGGHVGKITAVRADGAIRVLSGNDGRAVRDRWRSARGVIAYRAL